MEISHMTITELYEDFISDCRMRMLSKKTISGYGDFLRPFLTSVGPDLPIQVLSDSMIKRYVLGMSERPVSRATYCTYLRHLKAFLNWACREYDLTVNPKKIKVPKDEKKCPYLYSDDEIRRLFSSVHAESKWLTARNCAMISLMLDSGLRQSEVCGLLWENVYFAEKYLKVKGKGSKERIVSLGSYSVRFIQEYRCLCPYTGSPYVFVERRGTPVTSNSLKQAIQKLKKLVPFPVYCHLLRHNFATNWCLDSYESCGRFDAYSLMVLMGHENIKTTERYLHHARSLIAARHSTSHLDKLFSAP